MKIEKELEKMERELKNQKKEKHFFVEDDILAEKSLKGDFDKEQEMINEILNYEEDYVKIVKVNWNDAQTINDTLSLLEIRKTGLIDVITIGYLIEEDENSIKVCGFLFPDTDSDIEDPKGNTGFREVHFIPRKMIKSILVLETNWEKSKKLREEYNG